MNTAVRRAPLTRTRVALAALALISLIAGLLGVAAPAQAAVAGSITGQVRLGSNPGVADETGTPATSADVALTYSLFADGAFGPEVAAPPIASSGQFTIPDLPAGDYRVRVVAQRPPYQSGYAGSGFHAQWNGWDDGVVYVATGQTTTVPTVVVPALRTLTGTVYLGSRSRAARAGEVAISLETYDRATFSWSAAVGKTASSGADGTFSIPGLLNVPYRVTYRYSGSEAFRSETVPLDEDGIIPAAGPRPTATVVIPALYSLSGHVELAGAGAAPAGAVQVTVGSNENFANIVATVDTRASGEWSVPALVAGTYYVRYRYVGTSGAYLQQVRAERIVAADLRAVTVALPLTNRVTGRVTGGGVAIPNVVVSAWRNAAQGPQIYAGQVSTGADGRYSFPDLADGDYEILFQPNGSTFAPEYYPGVSQYYQGDVLALRGGLTADVDATLERAGVVSGVVRGSWLTPSDFSRVTVGIWVYDWDTDEWVHTGSNTGVASDGSYRIDSLYPDYYYFEAEWIGQPGYSNRFSDLTLVDPGSTTHLDFRLPTGVSGGVDFSGDGNSDVIVRTTSGALIEYLGDGGGSWKGSKAIGSGWNGFASVINAGDFSGDGNPDMLARTASGDLYLYRGDGASGWAGAGKKIGSGWNGFDTVFSPGDFDGDGASDVIARTPGGGLYLYRGDGAGSWLGSKAIGSGWNGFSSVFPVGDFDGDGAVDVMARTPSGALYLYRGDGAGGWLGAKQVGSGWGGFTYVGGVGDFDGDGTSDVVARDLMGRLWLYRGSGTGSWLLASQIGSGWNGLLFVG